MLYIGLLISIISGFFASSAEIKLDGVIQKDEWAGAKEFNLSKGGKLYLIARGDALYIAVKGAAPGWAHVYLHWKDSINVMHASAALGDQLYTRDQSEWKLRRKFNWELRDSDYSNSARQKQENYYKTKGWCANNNSMGDKNTLEFKINRERFNASDLSFAALYTSDGESISHYPSTLSDATLLKHLVVGNHPDNIQFKPAQWTKFQQ